MDSEMYLYLVKCKNGGENEKNNYIINFLYDFFKLCKCLCYRR